jgi:hypothetical protein
MVPIYFFFLLSGSFSSRPTPATQADLHVLRNSLIRPPSSETRKGNQGGARFFVVPWIQKVSTEERMGMKVTNLFSMGA